MKNFLVAMVLMVGSTCALARDDISDYSVEEAMSTPKVSSAVGEGVIFYFGQQKHPKILQDFGEFRSNKKTNAFGKSDKAACQWAFASAIKSLKQRAEKEGGNAVVNIRSNYKGNMTASDATFKCGAGAIMAGVALVGDVVRVEE
ncbi:hypothetical protein [Microbulbifer sp. THAF38]|uniref:hypothetical protein n=1 Tax=Microbulbifer sp. THAF38 TaxID=2587856 RepID=UPI001268CC35|nr:hypothetical protein [Microbulbifer sp. THAF38]QFT54597.1 hypothetical protein FIU95_08535 [Microbulbifer sp. THAF38]